MKLTLLLIALFGLAHSRIIKVLVKEPVDRFDVDELTNDHDQEDQEDVDKSYKYRVQQNEEEAGRLYGIRSGLRTNAQGSANLQTPDYVADQQASDQDATYLTKSTSAESAIQAAATANAALAGKRVLLESIEKQTNQAHHSLEAESVHLTEVERSVAAAKESAKQTSRQVTVLTAALNGARLVSEHAELAASEAAAELASQTAMYGKAKVHLETIERDLHAAEIDHEATKEAAANASAAAQAAQKNVESAEIHATLKLQESAKGHNSELEDFTYNRHHS